MAIELPEFATSGANETEPTTALKSSGWAAGDQPPAQIFNWQSRVTYDFSRKALGMIQTATAAQHGGKYHKIDGGLATFAGECMGEDGGILIASGDNGSTTEYVYTSTDGGYAWTQRYSGTASFTTLGLLIVPGTYAVLVGSSTSLWLYANSPYTSWTLVNSATFANGGGIGYGHCVTQIDGNDALLLTDRTSLYFADATAVPTVAGDFTQIDLSTIFTTDVYGLATNGTYNVAVGDFGGAARYAYSLTSAGSVVGDWTAANFSTGTVARDVVWTGDKFVAIVTNGTATEFWFSLTDPTGWQLAQSVTPTNPLERLIVDQETGFLCAYESGGGSGDIWVSRDGVNWFVGLSNAVTAICSDRFGYSTNQRRVCGFSSDASAYFMPFG